MKNCFYLFCFLFFLTACQKKSSSGPIQVDLTNTESAINYSSFVDSATIVTLELSDSLPINGVSGLFFDDGKIFVMDSGQEGIFVFDEKSGQQLAHLNAFGEGPEEIKRIGAWCLDSFQKHICIFDKGDMKIKEYDYVGNYISSFSMEYFLLDMVKFGKESMVCFYPIFAGHEQPEGVWLDNMGHFNKSISSHVTESCKFHYFPVMYNWNGSSAYYYDRNWDELSLVTNDTLQLLYAFDIKQAIPLSIKGERDLTPEKLDGRSIVHQFTYSNNFILVSFHTFHQDDMSQKDITWMLFDKRKKSISTSKSLINDLNAGYEINGYGLFYKNDHTWVRVDDSLDGKIQLEYLFLQ